MTDNLALTMGEPTPRPGPALSATSDMPAFKQAAAEPTQAPPAPAAKTVDENGKKPDKGDTGPEKEPGEASDPPANSDTTPPAIKREITLERNRRRAAEERAERAERERAQALEALSKLQPEKPKVAERPQRSSFDDPDAYDDALIKWSEERTRESERATRETSRAQTEVQKVVETFVSRRDAFKAEHEDWDEVVERDDLKIGPAMRDAIMESDLGPAIAYHLGKNPELADRIYGLPPIQQIREIGKIEARLDDADDVPPPPRPKPAPIEKVGGRANASKKTAADETMEEYAARRQKELRGAR